MSTANEKKAEEAITKWERAQEALSNTRKRVAEKAEEGVEYAACIAGGAGGGWLDKHYGDKEILGVKASIVLGGAMVAAGATDSAGKQSGVVGHAGLGILAYEAGKYVAGKGPDDNSSGVDVAGAAPARGAAAAQRNKPLSAEDMRRIMGLA